MANNKKLHGFKSILSVMMASVIAATSFSAMPAVAYAEEEIVIDQSVIDDTDGVFTLAEDDGATSAEWTGEIASAYQGGSGTQASPYLIATAEQLALLATTVSTETQGKYYKLTADILLNDNVNFGATAWVDAMDFAGTLDGDGHNVIGLYMNNSNNHKGLFKYNYGTITDLNMTDGRIVCSGNGGGAGGICGANSSGTINDVACIGSIINCTSAVNISSSSINISFGGICGSNSGTVKNCTNKGEVYITGGTSSTYSENIGGVCGINRGTLENCSNTGYIHSSSTAYTQNFGGVCGYNVGGKVKNCSNSGTVTSVNEDGYSGDVGGVCGENSNSLEKCSNTGKVDGLVHTGGVCGYNTSTIIDCYNKAEITASSYTGGVCGRTDGDATVAGMLGCYNTGKITGNGSVGGVCGYFYGYLMMNCYNTGEINNTGNTGGICGFLYRGEINGCYNTGAVIGGSAYSYHGGIAGDLVNYASIKNCYNTGAVSGYSYVGGIYGYSSSDYAANNYLENLINAGTVSGTEYVYPIGNGNGVITNNYFDSDVCGFTDSEYAKTSKQLTASTALADLGFDTSVWAKKANTDVYWYYPDLKAFDNDGAYVIAGTPAPENVKAVAGNGKVTLTWNKVSIATKYKIRRHDGTKWSDYKVQTANSLTDTSVTNGTTYKYCVYAYGNNKWSAASATVAAKPTIPAPTNVKATAGENKITVTWSAVSGATKYKVRRHDGTSWSDYKTVTTTSLTDTAVTAGKTYKYAVYAYSNGKFGAASATVSAVPKTAVPTNVKAIAGAGEITLTWNAVTGATKYKVRRHNGTSWSDYKVVSTTGLTDTSVTVGKTYKYAVYAYAGGKYGAASATVSAIPKAAAPANIKAVAGAGKVTLTWNAVSGATKYKIRRHNGTSWSDLKIVSDTTYIDTVVTNGTTYKYSVYAYVGNAYGVASEIVSAKPMAAPTNVKATATSGKITVTWTGVSGATKYKVRRHNGTSWADYKTVTTTSLADTSVTAGKTYKYAVYAYVGGTWSPASATVSATAK